MLIEKIEYVVQGRMPIRKRFGRGLQISFQTARKGWRRRRGFGTFRIHFVFQAVRRREMRVSNPT